MDDVRHVKAFVAKDTGAINEADHSILFVVSTNVIDRDNEIVDAKAVLDAIRRPGQFAENPIAPPAHMDRLDSGMPACVGHWDVASAQLVRQGSHEAVQMRLNFAWDTQLGGEYWRYYAGRHMRAVSIGFRSLEWHMEQIDGTSVRVITDIELYEISCVAIPANPQALAAKLSPAHETEQDAQLAAVQSRIEALEARLEQIIDEKIGALLDDTLTDPDDLAKSLLGGGSDPVGDGGLDLAEDAFERIKRALNPKG